MSEESTQRCTVSEVLHSVFQSGGIPLHGSIRHIQLSEAFKKALKSHLFITARLSPQHDK